MLVGRSPYAVTRLLDASSLIARRRFLDLSSCVATFHPPSRLSLLKMVAKVPNDRYQTARELIAAWKALPSARKGRQTLFGTWLIGVCCGCSHRCITISASHVYQGEQELIQRVTPLSRPAGQHQQATSASATIVQHRTLTPQKERFCRRFLAISLSDKADSGRV